MRILFGFLAIISLGISPAHGQTANDSTVLEPGDVVRILVWRRPEFSGDFPIAFDGSITHPLYRTVRVVNIPLPQVEARIKQFLTQYDAEPAFTFSPLLRIFVIGEIHQPNTLTVPPGTTVSQAIALAGGPTDQANLEKVRIIRAGATIPIDLTRPDLAVARTTIRSGDEIIVERSRNVLRDYIGPVAALIGGFGAVANIIIQTRK
jgi:protein involved in polysaccharide export with SLBB domain